MSRLMLRSLVSALLLFALLSVPSIASADPIVWTLQNVTFSGVDAMGNSTGPTSGTITGSFEFDPTTMTLIGNINIFSTPGNTTYTTLFDQSGSSTGFITEAAKTPSGVFPVLMLLFKGDLSNPGTDFLETGLLNGGGEGSCVAADCSGPNDPTQTRFITGGEACSAGSSCVAVPEPSTLSLLGMALVVLLAGATIRRVSHV